VQGRTQPALSNVEGSALRSKATHADCQGGNCAGQAAHAAECPLRRRIEAQGNFQGTHEALAQIRSVELHGQVKSI
jgi:hypothetical protein